MAYDTRYDPSTSFTMNGVIAHCQPYLKGGAEFSQATSPTLAQVEAMISRNVTRVALTLLKAGLSSTQTDDDIQTVLSTAVIYGTLRDIEFGKVNGAIQRGETGRWSLYRTEYERQMEMISDGSLKFMGATVTRAASAGLEFTGQTWSEQEDIAEDTDAKGGVFPRGFLEGVKRASADAEE